MRLGLSSAAAADACLDELLAACRARGLSTLELRAGDGHGVRAETDPVGVRAAAARADLDIAAFRSTASDDAHRLASLSAGLHAPVIVADDGGVAVRLELAARIIDAGGHALVAADGAAEGWLPAVAEAGIGYAWDVDPTNGDVAADGELLLRDGGARPTFIRLIGAGPEAAMQEGRGIGTLMGRLALARYDGPLVLAPSSSRYRVVWAAWLGRRGGWGCGSKAADPDLVRLATAG
jgi:hypothetical protein